MTPEQLKKGQRLTGEIELAESLLRISTATDKYFFEQVLTRSGVASDRTRSWLRDRIRLARLQLQKDIEQDLKDMQAQLEAL